MLPCNLVPGRGEQVGCTCSHPVELRIGWWQQALPGMPKALTSAAADACCQMDHNYAVECLQAGRQLLSGPSQIILGRIVFLCALDELSS